MINTLLGKKLDQTQKFLENGTRIPVTIIGLADNTVSQIKTVEKEGYASVQLGTGVKKKPTKALIGHVKKTGKDSVPARFYEVRVDGSDFPELGAQIALETVFQPGDIVDVIGTSKGKGFAGVVKRYNFRGGPKTHGQSDRHRAPGSIGQSTTPGRVYKGKRMAGHMGNETVTIQNLLVVDIDAENDLLFVAGLVPGHKNSNLCIVRTGENKKFVPLLKITEEKEEAPQAVSEEVAKEEIEAAEPALVEESEAKAEEKLNEEAEKVSKASEKETKEEIKAEK